MDDAARGQLQVEAAEIYDAFFVPALFGAWAEPVAEAASVSEGQRVLDVACGTGALTCALSERLGPGGRAVGVDVNEGMLSIARRKPEAVEWTKAPAEKLPFDDASFDRVVSQFGLMFFEDRVAAVSEMLRVLRPGGRMAVAVWASLDRTPGYTAVVQLLAELFGEQVADALRAPYCLGDRVELESIFRSAGCEQVDITTPSGTACFPSIDSWMFTDVKGWTLRDMIDDQQFELLRERAKDALSRFVAQDGSVRFEHPAHLVTVDKP